MSIEAHPQLRKFTLLAASSLTIMAGATISPGLPAINGAFADHRSAGLLIPLVLTIPALFIALCAPLAGLVLDRFGRRQLFMISLCCYALAGSSGLYLNTLTGLLIGRALLGISVAGVMTAATTLIADYYVDAERSRLIGLQGTFVALGGMIFMSAGGALSDVHWRAPFAIYLASLLIVPAVLASIAEPALKKSAERSAANPGSSHARSTTLLIYLTAFIGMLIFYMIPVYFPFYLQNRFNVGPTQTGLVLAFAILVSATVSWQYRRIWKRLHFITIFSVVFLGMGLGFIFLYMADTVPLVMAALCFSGAGMGLFMPNLNMCLAEVAPEAVRGRAIGGLNTSLCLGQFLTPIVLAPAIQHWSEAAAFGAAGLFMLILSALFLIFAQAIAKS